MSTAKNFSELNFILREALGAICVELYFFLEECNFFKRGYSKYAENL